MATKRQKQIVEHFIKSEAKKALREANVVRTETITKYTEKCINDIAKFSKVDSAADFIKIAEAMVIHLTSKHIRYKK